MGRGNKRVQDSDKGKPSQGKRRRTRRNAEVDELVAMN